MFGGLHILQCVISLLIWLYFFSGTGNLYNFIALFSTGNLEIICNDKYICFCDFYLQYCLIKVKFSHTDTQSNMSIFIQQNNCLMKVVCRYTSLHLYNSIIMHIIPQLVFFIWFFVFCPKYALHIFMLDWVW